MCAGPDGPLSTIRLESIRDGIEDYEYYLLLRRLLEERGERQVWPGVTASGCHRRAARPLLATQKRSVRPWQ